MTSEIPFSKQEHALASRVMNVFHKNVTHRSTSGADKVLMDALKAWARTPSQEDLNLFRSMGVLPKTYDSLTRVKLVQIMAVLNRVFGQIGDKFWEIAPSPDPVLPIDVEAGIVFKYAQEGMIMAKAKKATSDADIAEIVAATVQANEKQIHKDRVRVAAERGERMGLIVDDKLLEAGFSVTIVRQYVANLTKFGTGVIIGPCEEPVVELKLHSEKSSVVYRPEIVNKMRFTVPSTLDVYPSPGMVEANDADLCVRVRYTKAELARAANVKTGAKSSWHRAVIQKLLKEHPNGIDIGSQTMTDTDEKAAQLGEIQGTTERYEGVRWFGLASGRELRQLGINSWNEGKILANFYYEVDAVVLGGRVIYAHVADSAIGRPVVKTTFYGDSVQFFGWPPASQIDNCQSLMNIAMAALKKQLQLAGLTPMEVEGYSDYVDSNRPGAFALAPGKVFLKTRNAFSQGQQGAGIHPIDIPNRIKEILVIFEAIFRLTDDASGFNRNMLGSGNYTGAARTASGLMQIQEAASIIATFVIGNIDATAMVPLLNKVVASINRNHPDNKAKGDSQIISRGQLAKVMKASQQQTIASVFQATQGGVMPKLLGPDQMLNAFREYLKSSEFPNADKIIPDEERVEFLKGLADAKASLEVLAGAAGGGGQPAGPQGAQNGQVGAPVQAQPQQAAKEAGMATESQTEARRGAA